MRIIGKHRKKILIINYNFMLKSIINYCFFLNKFIIILLNSNLTLIFLTPIKRMMLFKSFGIILEEYPTNAFVLSEYLNTDSRDNASEIK